MDPDSGLSDELLKRTHPHGQRHGHKRSASKPDCLNGRDQLSRCWAEDCNMIAGLNPSSLQSSSNHSGLGMELGPANCLMVISRDEGHEPIITFGGCFNSINQREHDALTLQSRSRLQETSEGRDRSVRKGPCPAVQTGSSDQQIEQLWWASNDPMRFGALELLLHLV